MKTKQNKENSQKKFFQSDYEFGERRKILGLWFERDLSFKTHAAIISASMAKFWKESSVLITQGLNPIYAVHIFDSYVKPRVTYCMNIWFHQNMTFLDKMWRSVHKSIFGIRNYQVSKHVVSLFSNLWPLSLLYTNQVFIFLHSTARSADILNPGNLALIPEYVILVTIFLVHKLAIVNRDPDEIKAIYIQFARKCPVSTFKKEVDEYCSHLWQREMKQLCDKNGC